MPMLKNRDRDLAAAEAFAKWKDESGYTDGAIGNLIGKSSAAVATWRAGTRPHPEVHGRLARLTGWDWDFPPGYVDPNAPTTPVVAKVRKLRKPKAPKVVAAPQPVVAKSPLRDLQIAKSYLEDGTAITPQSIALLRTICLPLIDAKMVDVQNAEAISRTELRAIVESHKDPQAVLAFLKEHTVLLDTANVPSVATA